MDLSRTQLTGLLSNVSHEKTRFIQLMHKLKAILSLSKDHKLILTSLDKLLITSSPLIIYQNINFSHPILKILMEIIEKTKKMGEGEKVFVEILKSLVDKITYLLDNGIKAKKISDVLKDLKLEIKEAELPNVGMLSLSSTGTGARDCVKPYISQTIGDETITNLLLQAIQNTQSYDVENIRICKVATGATEDSYLVDGMLFNRAVEGTVNYLTNTSIGIFNCPFDINRTELKGTVLMHTAKELLNFTNDEVQSSKAIIDTLNVNAVVVCGNVNSLFVDFANARNILVLRVFSKFDLKRLSTLLNCEIATVLGPVHQPGFITSISTVHDGNKAFTKIVAKGSVNTIVIKNTMIQTCDEIERKITVVLESLKKNSKNNQIEGSFDSKVKPTGAHSSSETGNGLTEEPENMENNTVSNSDVYGDRKLETSCDIFETSRNNNFSSIEFFNEAAESIGNSTVIHSTIANGLRQVTFDKVLFFKDQVKCVRFAFDFLATMLEVDDYLVAKAEQMNIKPRENPHWDDD